MDSFILCSEINILRENIVCDLTNPAALSTTYKKVSYLIS